MPKVPSANEIRQRYLDFFAKKYKHTIVPSSSLVPGGDATLLFTNSGMVQFKDVFLGTDKRPYKRAVDSQKCLRVAGKHNDLEDVGFDNTHHTFFEMLGNWSFGDYYKKEAIAWAWELLTKEWKLDPARLYASVFKDEQGEIETDDEAATNWLAQSGFDRGHLVYYGRKDNFWEMADTGPCGPNSEIYYDFGSDYGEIKKNAAGEIDLAAPRFVEIWNLVFIQYNRTGPKTLKPLPAKHVDTGMGLERMTTVLQKTGSNYRTDLFTPIIAKVQKLVGHSDKQVEENFTPYRVIADHSRAATFLIADGVVPGNVGRNYITRMIIRRAARFGSKIGLDEPFMASLAEVVIEHYGEAYPELVAKKKTILENLAREENRFQRTLESGLVYIENAVADAMREGSRVISGKVAFDIHTSHGIPIEVLKDIVREKGLEVDDKKFLEEMKRHKELSLGGKLSMSGEVTTKLIKGKQHLLADQAELYSNIVFSLKKEKKLTSRGVKYDPYNRLVTPGKILALVIDGRAVRQAQLGEQVEVLLPSTGFYVASGGQVSDTGEIRSANGKRPWIITVKNVVRPTSDAVVHIGEVMQGNPKVGDKSTAEVDRRRRQDIMRNHTATHLLHAALHQIVGEHASQAGSFVAADRLRFDFTHPEALTKEQRSQVEDKVNEWIFDSYSVRVKTMTLEKAKKQGAIALFGEKYGADVRTIGIGAHDFFSYELCGGTHVENTSQIGLFQILSESSTAAGVRRVEAVTGRVAYKIVKGRHAALDLAAGILRASPEQIPEKLNSMLAELSKKNKQLSGLSKSQSGESIEEMLNNALLNSGVALLTRHIPEADVTVLRHIADRFRQQHPSGVALLAGTHDGRATLIAAITKDLVTRGLHAGDLVKLAAEKIGGSGGGKPELAQAGGTDNGHVAEALALAAPWVEEKLK